MGMGCVLLARHAPHGEGGASQQCSPPQQRGGGGEEDLIVTYFNLQEIRNPDGIKAYMNVLADRNETLVVYDLRRVPEGWPGLDHQ